MKRFLILALTCMMVASMAACSSSETASAEPSAPAQTAEQQEKAPSETAEAPAQAEAPAATDSGDLGSYHVAIKDAAQATDYEGNPVLIVNFDFTNNSEEATSFMLATNVDAFQDGVELEMAIMMDDNYDGDAQLKDIKPGTTLPVQVAYSLTSQTPVTVEVTELFSFDDAAMLTKEFSLS